MLAGPLGIRQKLPWAKTPLYVTINTIEIHKSQYTLTIGPITMPPICHQFPHPTLESQPRQRGRQCWIALQFLHLARESWKQTGVLQENPPTFELEARDPPLHLGGFFQHCRVNTAVGDCWTVLWSSLPETVGRQFRTSLGDELYLCLPRRYGDGTGRECSSEFPGSCQVEDKDCLGRCDPKGNRSIS